MNIILINVALIFVYFLQNSVCNRCNSFRDVLIHLKTKDGRKFNYTSNSCIQRSSFDPNTVVAEATFYQQNIPILGEDSIKHLVHLKRVTIDNCTIKQIIPNAFRNIPRLEYVNITNCKYLETVAFWVFTEIPSLKILHLDNNNINKIENLSFSDLEFLQEIYLRQNSLKDWQRQWFQNTTNVVLLDFSYNKIERLQKNSFKDLRRLQRISFDFNEIAIIEKDTFKGLKRLDYLGLKHNRLKQLNANILANRLNIKILLLGANYLNFLSKDLLKNLKIDRIGIYHNPWKCRCLDELYNWIHVNNVTIKSNNNCKNNGRVPVCRVIENNTTCIETIIDDYLDEYFNAIKKIQPTVNSDCVRLD